MTVDPTEAVSEYLVPDLAVLLVELTGIDDIASSSKSSNLTSAEVLILLSTLYIKKFHTFLMHFSLFFILPLATLHLSSGLFPFCKSCSKVRVMSTT